MRRSAIGAALAWLAAALATVAAATGILLRGGPGPYEHVSIRGQPVQIYGVGLYQHMSADVAPQGIAQDVVTLLVAVPLLAVALRLSRSGRLDARLLVAGTLLYLAVTYLFYMLMAMYNVMFLVYVAAASAAFYALVLTMLDIKLDGLGARFDASAPAVAAGGFLMFSAGAIAWLWLGVIVPPLASGAIIPSAIEHYTTLVVQGMDLAILLPLSAAAGWGLSRRLNWGFYLGTPFLVFLAVLMTALSAKVLAMAALGQDVVPVIVIIPAFNLTAAVLATRMLRGIRGG